jgi:hypothetical protein
LEKAVRDNGGDPIVGKFGWQFKMFTDANIILNESDTPEIRALKVEFIDKWKASFRSHRLIIWMFFVGIVLSAIAQAIGTLIVK